MSIITLSEGVAVCSCVVLCIAGQFREGRVELLIYKGQNIDDRSLLKK